MVSIGTRKQELLSHSNKNAPSVVIRDMEEAKLLSEFITGSRKKEEFINSLKINTLKILTLIRI